MHEQNNLLVYHNKANAPATATIAMHDTSCNIDAAPPVKVVVGADEEDEGGLAEVMVTVADDTDVG